MDSNYPAVKTRSNCWQMGAGVIEVTTRNGMSSRKELNLHGVDKPRLGFSVR
jgi:hypothetical protein